MDAGAFAVKGWVSGKSYSTMAACTPRELDTANIDPWFFTGFTDAEGSFILRIRDNNKLSTGYSVQLGFQIGLHKRDRSILENIKSTLNVGVISDNGNSAPHPLHSCLRPRCGALQHKGDEVKGGGGEF